MFCTDPERQSLTQTADDGDEGSGDVDEDGDGTKAYLDLAPARHIEMPGWPHTLRDQSCTLDSVSQTHANRALHILDHMAGFDMALVLKVLKQNQRLKFIEIFL